MRNTFVLLGCKWIITTTLRQLHHPDLFSCEGPNILQLSVCSEECGSQKSGTIAVLI